MRDVLENALLHGLQLMQIRPVVPRNAVPQDVMVAAFDDVNGVDLHVTEVLDRGQDRLRSGAERLLLVEPLGTKPDPAGRRLIDLYCPRIHGPNGTRARASMTSFALCGLMSTLDGSIQ
ncbi:MAG TPA: hypothetical protein VHC49_20150 [Mycobacteriales bacterium]|nr:hypothetical protein [Mycobacteriales bacterium]